jgi:aryl-alcohol dehydrogenase-like predicted oxidoreductase
MSNAVKPAAGAGQFKVGGAFAVNRIGYGAMRITGQPGNWGPFRDPAYAHRLLRRAYELGVTFIDTAISYGNGWSE